MHKNFLFLTILAFLTVILLFLISYNTENINTDNIDIEEYQKYIENNQNIYKTN